MVAAAGWGTRLQRLHSAPKALIEVAGRPLVEMAVANLRAAGIGEVVVVHPAGHREAFAAATAAHRPVRLVEGGRTRTESVRRGVRATGAGWDLVAVHDAARPLTPPEVISAAVAAVEGEVIAAAPGRAVADTLKRVTAPGVVSATAPRRGVWAVHTPQVIRAEVLRKALALAGDRGASDDLALVEAAREAGVVSGLIRLVPGDTRDLKITYPEDLDLATALVESLLTGREEGSGSAVRGGGG